MTIGGRTGCGRTQPRSIRLKLLLRQVSNGKAIVTAMARSAISSSRSHTVMCSPSALRPRVGRSASSGGAPATSALRCAARLHKTAAVHSAMIHRYWPFPNLALTMLHMIQAGLEQIGDVSVQRVKDLAPVFARLYQPHLPQCAQVMRDCRFTQLDGLRQGADILLAFNQHGNNA